MNTIGTYFVVYTATDHQGNPAVPVTRTVRVLDPTAKSISSFIFTNPAATGVITGTNIDFVPFKSGSSVTAITPTIVFDGLTISPDSGLAQDFTHPVTYTVTALDNSTRTYTVSITVRRATQPRVSGFHYDETTTTTPPADTTTPPADTTTPPTDTVTPPVDTTTPPTPPAGEVLGAETYKFTKILRKGSSGPEVVELQNVLRAAGLLKYPTSTGRFGPLTVAAVKVYQAMHKLPATGIVGAMTRAELNK